MSVKSCSKATLKGRGILRWMSVKSCSKATLKGRGHIKVDEYIEL